MLTKNNPDAQSASADVGQVLKVLDDCNLFSKLGKIARLPHSKVEQFKNEFLDTAQKSWLLHTRAVIQAPAVAAAFEEVSNAAYTLGQLLTALRDAQENHGRGSAGPLKPLNQEASFGIAGLLLFESLSGVVNISRLQAELTMVATMAKIQKWEMTPRRGRSGRPKGVKDFPGLDVLVFDLERNARAAGGGFHINKRDCKGSLLDALDLLRTFLLTFPQTRDLALLLPRPSQHPLATYGRIMSDARRGHDRNA